MSLLTVEDLTVTFGGVTAVDAMNLTVDESSICGLIGPNGAGKTTLFNSVTRNVEPSGGRIRFDDVDLLAQRPDTLARIGVKRTFQNLALFPTMDVRTNVLVGAHSLGSVGWVRSALRAGVRAEERRLRERADEVLGLLGLQDVAEERVGELPFGTLKRVELGRALVSSPRLLLLDEPANGLREGEVAELGDLLLTIRRDFNLTMVVVEHHVSLVMRLCDSVAAMAAGRLIARGEPSAVRSHPEVRRVFLGEAA